MNHTHSDGRNEDAYAALFGLFLVSIMLCSLIVAFQAAGPIVLGTEMNTNGLVEYLCIGRGCENIN